MRLTNILAGAFLSVNVFGLFSDDEFHILESSCKFLNVAFLVFVEDDFISPGAMDAVKRSSEHNVPSTAVTSSQLTEILTSDTKFFSQRTMLATKRKISLGSFLKMVDTPKNLRKLSPAEAIRKIVNFYQVQHPKLVVWALFVDPSDADTVGHGISYQGRILRIKPESNRLVAYELLHTDESGGILQRILGYVRSGSTAEYFPRQWEDFSQKLNMSNFVVKVGISSEICRSRKDGVLLEVIFCCHSQILELMVEKLNIRKEYIRYPETQYSFVYPNGSYSGYFKMVLDKEVNMSVAGFVVTSRRLEHFDFIWPTFALDTMMYLKKADIVKASLSSSPFSNAVWIIISTWTVATGSFLYVSSYCNRECGTRRGNPCRAISNSILKVLQLICNQGSSDDPFSSSSRILYTTSLFGGMLLYYYYSAVVLSFLTVESIDLPFTDLEGFIKNKKYKIIAPAGGFVSYFIEFELTQFRHRAGRYIIPSDKLPSSIYECVTQVCDRESLILLECEGALLNIQESKCELTRIPTPVFTQFFGFALVKGFPLTEYFEMVLWRLKEIGLLMRMQRNLSQYSDVQSLHKDSDYNAVALEQIMNVLIILSLGFLLSFSILILELLCHRQQRRQKRGTGTGGAPGHKGNTTFYCSVMKGFHFQQKPIPKVKL